jgi:hypothetical protein
MKLYKILNNVLVAGVIIVLLTNCGPQIAKEQDLPAPSNASFTMTQSTTDPNTYILQNTTPGGFLTRWDLGILGTSTSSPDTVFFGAKGIYPIILTTASKGGITSHTDTLRIDSTSIYYANFSVHQLGSNRFIVSVITPNVKSVFWNFPTGDTSIAMVDTIYLPFSGVYPISLTASTIKGAALLKSTLVQNVSVASDDPANPDLANPIYNIYELLSGGSTSSTGKTWVLDTDAGTSGVGPAATLGLTYALNGALNYGIWTNGMAANAFTFQMRGYKFIPKNQQATGASLFVDKRFGWTQAAYHDTNFVDPLLKQVEFKIKPATLQHPAGTTGYELDITNGGYMGYWENRSNYQIVSISADTLYIRQIYTDDPNASPANDNNARYFTFIAQP